MKAELTINMDNAAFENPSELARILRELADKIESNEGVSSGDKLVARDINGNTVGTLTIA